MKPTFILGLGAQKSGTTWLHRYLNSFDCANFGVRKEYHVWDVKFMPDQFQGWWKLQPGNKETDGNALRRLMADVDGAYESYFAGLINNTVRLTGDISPSYTALKADHLATIKGRMEAAGFSVQPILLMRDPVERCWSGTRMHYRREREKGRSFTDADVRQSFASSFSAKAVVIRTQYDRTLQALDEVFQPDEYYVGIYETMFSPEAIKSLSEFVGVPPKPEFGERVFNETEDMTLSYEDRQACYTYYQDTYDYCLKRFPELSDLWWKP